MSKLTLHVPDELVAAAKSEAKARQVSVSKLVADCFRHLAATRSQEAPDSVKRLAPITRRLAGCVEDADLESYVDYSGNKHS